MSRRLAILALLLFLPALAEDTFRGIARVVAVGDIHGDYEQFLTILRQAELIDQDGNWSGGKAHLVQTGDVPDRGPRSRDCMDLLMKLEKQARSAGGYVHALIGNHDAMNVYGDLRYVSKEDYANWARDAKKPKEGDAAHPPGYAEHRALLSPDGKYGRWIRGHNAIVRIDRTIFVHGGIGAKMAGLSIRQINERVREELADPEKLKGGLATDPDGPLWYRGLASGDEKELGPVVDSVLKKWDADRIVIGHTFADGAVTPRFGGRVLMIDIGLSRIYDAFLRQACLVIDSGKPYALHRGHRLELPGDSGKDLLRYLKEAAALDAPPSSLEKRIARLEATLGGG